VRYHEAVPRALTFTDHGRDLDQNRYVYAVVSRRARGLSIGVNLNTDKVCNFDCPYCQVDRRTPGGPAQVDVTLLGVELEALLDRARSGTLWAHPLFDTTPAALRRVADVAFAGDGEPTTPREFPAAARAAREALDRMALGVPLRLLTNATMLDRPRVRGVLPLFDALWCKLDAGTEAYFQRVDGTRLPFRKVLDNLLGVARERPIVIQSMFVTLEGEGPPEAEIGAYAGRLREIVDQGGGIDIVQVYTVARRPADARVGPLADERLERIAERVRAEGLRAEVYGAA
jgi:wyosine [tRNA(Phe)-imidazoG37] synthetase (radical SAM superfamily)